MKVFCVPDDSGIIVAGMQLVSLEQWLHVDSRITGRGTPTDPYLGGEAVIEGLAAGSTGILTGYWLFTREVHTTVDNLWLQGNGIGSTVLQGNFATAGKAILRMTSSSGSLMMRAKVTDITFDGKGLVKYGLYVDQSAQCIFRDLNFINAVDWCMISGFSINNEYSNLKAIAAAYPFALVNGSNVFPMTHATTNGFKFGDSTATGYLGDTSSTVNTVSNLEVVGLPGTGVKIEQGFSCVFNGGASELNGVNLELDANATNCIFNGFDCESSTTPLLIGGSKNSFVNCNMIASALNVSGGQITFDRCVLGSPIVDSGTDYNVYIDSVASRASVTGSNTKVVVKNSGGTDMQMGGTSYWHFVSTDAGDVVLEMECRGNRLANIVEKSGVGFYLCDSGGLANFTKATLDLNSGFFMQNRRVWLGAPASAPADSFIPAGSVEVHLDEVGNNLKFRVRYSDGTTLKTGTVALV